MKKARDLGLARKGLELQLLGLGPSFQGFASCVADSMFNDWPLGKPGSKGFLPTPSLLPVPPSAAQRPSSSLSPTRSWSPTPPASQVRKSHGSGRSRDPDPVVSWWRN